MLSRSKELEKELDNDISIIYNRRKKTQYIPYDKVGNDVVRRIRTELKKIYNDLDSVADSIAIEYGDNVYIVDSGNENGDENLEKSYQVIREDPNITKEKFLEIMQIEEEDH